MTKDFCVTGLREILIRTFTNDGRNIFSILPMSYLNGWSIYLYVVVKYLIEPYVF